MRNLAVIADCHGNSYALLAVLEDIEARGVSDIVNLGDSSDAALDPAGVISFLMDRGVPSIAGNYETYAEGQLTNDQMAWFPNCPRRSSWEKFSAAMVIRHVIIRNSSKILHCPMSVWRVQKPF